LLRSPDYDDARLAVLLERARQRSRALKRRQRLRRCLGGAAALVLIAGLAGGFALVRAGNGQQIQTAADMTRVEHALAARGGDSLVGYARTVFPTGVVVTPAVGGFTTEMEQGTRPLRSPLTTGVMVMWTYQHNMTVSAFTASGQLIFTEEVTAGERRATTVTVAYSDATWWRATVTLPPGALDPAQPGCRFPQDPGSGGWPAFIRQELSCGAYHEDGRQRAGGIDAIKLTGSSGLVLWINPSTYLPVRQVDLGPSTTDFRWFRATPASLAKLNVQVPAGFRQVRPPSGQLHEPPGARHRASPQAIR
jgi:hypothetical protein